MPFDGLRAVSMVERFGATQRKVEGWERDGVRGCHAFASESMILRIADAASPRDAAIFHRISPRRRFITGPAKTIALLPRGTYS